MRVRAQNVVVFRVQFSLFNQLDWEILSIPFPKSPLTNPKPPKEYFFNAITPLNINCIDLPSATTFLCVSICYVPGQIEQGNEVESCEKEHISKTNCDERSNEKKRSNPYKHRERLFPSLKRN